MDAIAVVILATGSAAAFATRFATRLASGVPTVLPDAVAICLAICLLVALPATTHATFSIVAHDPETGEVGVAVQSRAFNVGDRVVWVDAEVGAIATQASTNASFGPRGLALLGQGYDPETTLWMLLGEDSGREDRQVGIVDHEGRSAAWTGANCQDWAGHVRAPHLSIQGNILASEDVVRSMKQAFEETGGELAERMIAALHAAQRAGGDRRGMQSAAIVIGRPSATYPEYRTRYLSLQVADHPSPIDELERLFRIAQSEGILRAHLRYAEQYEKDGDALAAEGEFQRVGSALRYTLTKEDATAGGLNSLAWYCGTAGVFLEESLVAAERAAKLEPANTGILDTLAEIQFRLGRGQDALATIGRAIELSPDDAYLIGQRERFREGR